MRKLFFIALASIAISSCSKSSGTSTPTVTEVTISVTMTQLTKPTSISTLYWATIPKYSPQILQADTKVVVQWDVANGIGGYIGTFKDTIPVYKGQGANIHTTDIVGSPVYTASNIKILNVICADPGYHFNY